VICAISSDRTRTNMIRPICRHRLRLSGPDSGRHDCCRYCEYNA
jgi:hypothetical protein